MNLIEVRNLTKRFGDNLVLKGVDLTVADGEIVALIGPSGSGKSTLLRCLNYLEIPDGGEIRIAGQRLTSLPSERELVKLRSRLGMVFQRFHLFPHLTALQNVAEGPITVLGQPRAAALARAKELLARVGLAAKADSYPATLSGGQQQRVAIARAMAMAPLALLFDEPTSALDPELVGEVLQVIRDLAREGATMVIVTHEMRFAREVADRVVFLEEGAIVEAGPPAQLFQAPQTDRLRRFLGALAY